MSHRHPQHVRPRRTQIILPTWATYVLMVVFVLVVVGLGYLTFNGVKKLVSSAPVAPPGYSFGGSEAEAAATQTADPGYNPTWTGGRVNILLLGIDQRLTEEGPWRTDTMILLTIDPTTKRGGMLSIPRDLWVEIPDHNAYDRINTAHFRGDAEHYPGGGGPALAMKAVQQSFGLQVSYYVRVNFYAFVQAIDRLGCIPITVSETIDDPNYPAMEGPGFDPFYIEAGSHCMNGEILLKYARTRATFGSDFDRAKRQQQVIYAVHDHVLSTQQLPTLLAQAPQIYSTLQAGVSTNLSLDQLIELAQLATEIPKENICSAVIDGNYIEGMQTLPDGTQVLIPLRDDVRQLAQDIYNGTGRCAPGAQATEDISEQAAAERAVVNVLNGTSREGLATETGDMLTAMGINIISVGNAERFDYTKTIIYNYTGKTYTARYLAQLLQVPETAIVAATSPSGLFDIQVILGDDYRSSSP
ncbi:MAG: LCP family protein [Anaerolineae bacterium]|nr:LCP family protein [Anaerolineae bacterium]